MIGLCLFEQKSLQGFSKFFHNLLKIGEWKGFLLCVFQVETDYEEGQARKKTF